MHNIKFYLFPEGKRHCLTLSYDDGREYDHKLVEIMNKYGVRGTFHLNSQKFDTPGYIKSQDVKELYKNHEVSVHTATHPDLVKVPLPEATRQIIEDKMRLEELCGYPVRGMSYPFGTFNNELLNVLKSTGIEYSRTTRSTGMTGLPEDFLLWHPTCHHRENIAEKIEKFDDNRPWRGLSVFYLWGHSYEFNNNDNWHIIEDFCKEVEKRKENIWFATNIEIVDYINALRALKFSYDNSMCVNPTNTTVWVLADNEPVKIEPGFNQLF